MRENARKSKNPVRSLVGELPWYLRLPRRTRGRPFCFVQCMRGAKRPSALRRRAKGFNFCLGPEEPRTAKDFWGAKRPKSLVVYILASRPSSKFYSHFSLAMYDISGTKKILRSRAFRICITLGGANEVLALKKITFHPKLVKIRSIWLP